MRALALALALWASAPGACPLDAATRTGTVAHVIDGDTLVLTDRSKVRLLGLDAPELGHDGRPDEALARTARTRLSTLAPAGTALRLRTDAETHDRYRRLLAHAYLPDGTSIAATLLREGLGEVLILAPNLWQADCLARAEQRARTARRGVWALPSHRPRPAANIPIRTGYAVVRGTVTSVNVGRKGTAVRLDERVTLWVPRAVVALFPPPALTARTGREVIARGMLRMRGEGGSIVVRHPATLEWPP